jgi:hypothetical protein
MGAKSMTAELKERGADVELLPESTRFTDKYRVRMPGRPELRLTHQYVGGWKVSVGRKAYQTYSAAMTLALVTGEPLALALLTPAQRAAFDEVVAAGEAGLVSPRTSLRQLYTLGFVERVGKDHWRARPITSVPNPL